MKTGTFTGEDGSKRYYRAWLADASARGRVVIVHGYAEHGDRYAEMASDLNGAGFDVWAPDHYGHGLSEGKRADVPRFELFAEDLKLFTSTVVQADGNELPLFLYGHSMGGAVALLYTLRNQAALNGLILSGPVVRPGAQSSRAERRIGHILRLIYPSFKYLPFEAQKLSHDPEVVEAYIRDPMVYSKKMKIRMADELLRAEQLLSNEALKKLSLPMLILHGGDDQVVLPSNSEVVFTLSSSSDKTRHVFKGMYHEIHNEPGRKEVFTKVRSWLEEHV